MDVVLPQSYPKRIWTFIIINLKINNYRKRLNIWKNYTIMSQDNNYWTWRSWPKIVILQDRTVVHFSSYEKHELISTACQLNTLISAPRAKNLNTILSKYSHKVFHEVAHIPPLVESQIAELKASVPVQEAMELSWVTDLSFLLCLLSTCALSFNPLLPGEAFCKFPGRKGLISGGMSFVVNLWSQQFCM